FASLGLRAEGVLGPEGSGTLCGGSGCNYVAGYPAASLLLAARLHTLRVTPRVAGVALGAGRCVPTQCAWPRQHPTPGPGSATCGLWCCHAQAVRSSWSSSTRLSGLTSQM